MFLLGFPGHTMRYAPTSRLLYSDEVAVPAMMHDFARKVDVLLCDAVWCSVLQCVAVCCSVV